MSVPGPGSAPRDGTAAGDLQARFAATLVDEWLRCGVRDAVVCPGSRSAPLALALAAQAGAGLRVHVRLDERGAGFFAVGLALATGRPTVVCTTSGTATAELHPAVVEAHHARVPLLVCTADRPPELHHVGAPQVIDQEHLYGSAVRWFVSPGVADDAGRPAWRSIAARAVAEATGGPLGPGPVHLNLAFREPLSAPPARPDPAPPGPAHQVHRTTKGSTSPPGAAIVEAWATSPGTRGIVIAGAGCGPAADVLALAGLLGWPVLADPRSGCRVQGPDVRGVVGAADSFLRSPDVAEALRPEAVLVLGAPWASKVRARFVAAAAGVGEPGARVVAVDPWWQWRDPDRVVGDVVVADPSWWVSAVVDHLRGREPANSSPIATVWLDRWERVEAAAQLAVDTALGTQSDRALTEPAVARMILGTLSPGTTVVVSSSMPVRDLEWFSPPLAEPPVVLANRGVNGIDGVCSTTLGVAAGAQGPVMGVLGDLAFLHDVSALVRSDGGFTGAPCTLVVLDNHGGGIFSFLPQANDRDTARFEQLFGTPQAVSVAAVAEGFGLTVAEVSTADELRKALDRSPPTGGVHVVVVTLPDRADNVAEHERVNDAVCTAAGAALQR